ncbi:hypothetical protein CSUI_009649, partial [Cystoisospora suis]
SLLKSLPVLQALHEVLYWRQLKQREEPGCTIFTPSFGTSNATVTAETPCEYFRDVESRSLHGCHPDCTKWQKGWSSFAATSDSQGGKQSQMGLRHAPTSTKGMSPARTPASARRLKRVRPARQQDRADNEGAGRRRKMRASCSINGAAKTAEVNLKPEKRVSQSCSSPPGHQLPQPRDHQEVVRPSAPVWKPAPEPAGGGGSRRQQPGSESSPRRGCNSAFFFSSPVPLPGIRITSKCPAKALSAAERPPSTQSSSATSPHCAAGVWQPVTVLPYGTGESGKNSHR